MFRWWDGGAWTEHTTVNRRTEPPPAPPLPGPDPDGRYRAAGLSYPALDPPWRRCPGYPDIDDVVGQELVVGKTPRGPYIAGIFIGGLPARFGYAGPDDLDRAGRAFAQTMLRTYYPHESPHEGLHPSLGQLDRHRSWHATVELDVDDAHLDFRRETAIFTVVECGDRAAAFYASLPAVEQVPPAATVTRRLHCDWGPAPLTRRSTPCHSLAGVHICFRSISSEHL